jgi:glyoxylase-like metal-dependent hydrolase (beta-lactamase superfamily II)
MKMLPVAAAFLFLLGCSQTAPPPKKPDATGTKLTLWRLDCGSFVIKDYNSFFSDTLAYPAGPKDITDSCYLIRHGDRLMLWDTGVSDALIGSPQDNPAMKMALKRSLVDQLKQIGIGPDRIEIVGISHFHADHIGQAAHFPGAKLLIGAADLAALKATPPDPRLEPDLLKPWLGAGATVEAVQGDLDVFGDGSVVMLNTPGHTPGHHSLLVRLASGPVLLSGDVYHFTEQVANRGVPPFNTDRADSLASMDRFDRLAKNLKAKVIIQHEPADIAKLPAFPKGAQ